MLDDEDSGYTSKNRTESLPTAESVPDISELSPVCIEYFIFVKNLTEKILTSQTDST
jgi:hypothetical protein